jgi:hypothetical protein
MTLLPSQWGVIFCRPGETPGGFFTADNAERYLTSTGKDFFYFGIIDNAVRGGNSGRLNLG